MTWPWDDHLSGSKKRQPRSLASSVSKKSRKVCSEPCSLEPEKLLPKFNAAAISSSTVDSEPRNEGNLLGSLWDRLDADSEPESVFTPRQRMRGKQSVAKSALPHDSLPQSDTPGMKMSAMSPKSSRDRLGADSELESGCTPRQRISGKQSVAKSAQAHDSLPQSDTPGMKKPAMSPKGSSKADSAMVVKRTVTRSAWQLVFENSSMAGQACKLLQKANKEKQFCQPGTAPAVHDNKVVLQWHSPSLHYSVNAFFYRNESLRQIFGPGAKKFPWRLEPAESRDLPAGDLSSDDCKFDKCLIWSAEAKAHLQSQGFVIATSFVPAFLIQDGFADVEQHFTEVLQGFGLDYVRELKDVAKVPKKMWMRTPTLEVPDYNPFAKEQSSGVSTSTGYINSLGNGHALAPRVMCRYQSIVGCQIYAKPLLAHFLELDPEELCWKKEYVSVKGYGCEAAKLHKDTCNDGRLQAVVMLKSGSVIGCPRSHALPCKASDLQAGSHFHPTPAWETMVLSETLPREIKLQAGDVFIFMGGSFVHGCPAVSSKDEIRVVTYASFWPPGTTQGNEHAAGKCDCPRYAPAQRRK
jgi:hypothetical protein